MTSAKRLTVFGIEVSFTNFELLVSRGKFLPGSKTIFQTEIKESLFLELPLILCTYKQASHKALY